MRWRSHQDENTYAGSEKEERGVLIEEGSRFEMNEWRERREEPSSAISPVRFEYEYDGERIEESETFL